MDLWTTVLTLKPYIGRLVAAADLAVTAKEVHQLLKRLHQGDAGSRLEAAVWRAQCSAALELCSIAYQEMQAQRWRKLTIRSTWHVRESLVHQLDNLTQYLEEQSRSPRPPRSGAAPDPVQLAQVINGRRLAPADEAELARSMAEAFLDRLAATGHPIPPRIRQLILTAPERMAQPPGGWSGAFARWMEREVANDGHLSRHLVDAVVLSLSVLHPASPQDPAGQVAATLQPPAPPVAAPSPWQEVEEALQRHGSEDSRLNLRLRAWLPFLLHVPADELESQIKLLRTQLQQELGFESIAAKYGMGEVTQWIREALHRSPAPVGFVGRRADLDSLHRFLDGPGGRLMITAEAGAGKSALLAAWIRELSSFADCFVACHFFLQAHEVTQQVENAYRNILRQLIVYYQLKPEPLSNDATELRGMIISLLTDPERQARRLPKKLIIILDGLDEASDTFSPPFPAVLPEDVYIVASARVGPGDQPNYLRGWGDFRRFPIDALQEPAVREWLSQAEDGCLRPCLTDGFVAEVRNKTRGLPLMISLVAADLAEVAKQGLDPRTRLADTPTGLEAYVDREREALIGRIKDPAYAKELDLLYLLTVAHGALSAYDVYRLTQLNDDRIAKMTPRIRRWIVVTEYSGERYYTFCHRAIGEVLGAKSAIAAAEAREQLLAYCRAYRRKPTQYVRRYFAGHLAQAIVLGTDDAPELRRELYELALDDQFLEKQRADHELPGLPLRTLQTALSAQSLDDAGRFAELLLARFRRLMEVTRESPLALLTDPALPPNQQMLRALGIVELLRPREAALWLLLMAWELRDAGRAADMERALLRLRDLELPPLSGMLGWLGAVLVSCLADVDANLPHWITPALSKADRALLSELLGVWQTRIPGALERPPATATAAAAALARGETSVADVRQSAGPDGLVEVVAALAEAGRAALAIEVAVSPWDPTLHASLLTVCGRTLLQTGLPAEAAEAFTLARRSAERTGLTATEVWREQARTGGLASIEDLPAPLRDDAETLASLGLGKARAGLLQEAGVITAQAFTAARTPAAAEAVVRLQIEAGLTGQAAEAIPLLAGGGRRATLWMELARKVSPSAPHLAEGYFRRAVAEGAPLQTVIVHAAKAGMLGIANSLIGDLPEVSVRGDAFRHAVQAYLRSEPSAHRTDMTRNPADNQLLRAELAQMLSKHDVGARAPADIRAGVLIELHVGAGEFGRAMDAARELRDGWLRITWVRQILDLCEQDPGGAQMVRLVPMATDLATRTGVQDNVLARRLFALSLRHGETPAALQAIPLIETMKEQAEAVTLATQAILNLQGSGRASLFAELVQSVLRARRPAQLEPDAPKDSKAEAKRERQVATLLRCALTEIQRHEMTREGEAFLLQVAQKSERLAARLLPLTLLPLWEGGELDRAVGHLCEVFESSQPSRPSAQSDGVQALDRQSNYQVFQDACLDLLGLPSRTWPPTERPWTEWGSGGLRVGAEKWLEDLFGLAKPRQAVTGAPQGRLTIRPLRESDLLDESDVERRRTNVLVVRPPALAPPPAQRPGPGRPDAGGLPAKIEQVLEAVRSRPLVPSEVGELFGALDRLRYDRDVVVWKVALTLVAVKEDHLFKELLVRYLLFSEETVLYTCKLLTDWKPSAYEEVLTAVESHLSKPIR